MASSRSCACRLRLEEAHARGRPHEVEHRLLEAQPLGGVEVRDGLGELLPVGVRQSAMVMRRGVGRLQADGLAEILQRRVVLAAQRAEIAPHAEGHVPAGGQADGRLNVFQGRVQHAHLQLHAGPQHQPARMFGREFQRTIAVGQGVFELVFPEMGVRPAQQHQPAI